MNKLTRMMAVALLPLCESAAAQIVPIQWDATGQFSMQTAIAPGKFVEACAKLRKGGTVTWSFEAAHAIDFNIHFHEGKDVHYPAEKTQVQRESGILRATLEQDYCWMWSNKGTAEALLSLKLAKD